MLSLKMDTTMQMIWQMQFRGGKGVIVTLKQMYVIPILS